MSNGVSETLCTKCQHLRVCKWSKEYIDLQKRLNMEDLSDTPFCISLHCIHNSSEK